MLLQKEVDVDRDAEDGETERGQPEQEEVEAAHVLQPCERGCERHRWVVGFVDDRAQHRLLLVTTASRLTEERDREPEDERRDRQQQEGPPPPRGAADRGRDPSRDQRTDEKARRARCAVQGPTFDRIRVRDQRVVDRDDVGLAEAGADARDRQLPRSGDETGDELEHGEPDRADRGQQRAAGAVGEEPERDRAQDEEQSGHGRECTERGVADVKRPLDVRGQHLDRGPVEVLEHVDDRQRQHRCRAAATQHLPERHRGSADTRQQVVGKYRPVGPFGLLGLAARLLGQHRCDEGRRIVERLGRAVDGHWSAAGSVERVDRMPALAVGTPSFGALDVAQIELGARQCAGPERGRREQPDLVQAGDETGSGQVGPG